MGDKEWKVLFICLGNICRSPTAEAVFRQMAEAAGLQVMVDSAGIIDYHEGKLPDKRAIQTMKKHGLDVTHRARQITEEDFSKYDYIFGMDDANMSDLKQERPRTGATAIEELFGKYHTDKSLRIRDPYYDDGSEGFEVCYQQCVICSKNFIEHLKQQQQG